VGVVRGGGLRGAVVCGWSIGVKLTSQITFHWRYIFHIFMFHINSLQIFRLYVQPPNNFHILVTFIEFIIQRSTALIEL